MKYSLNIISDKTENSLEYSDPRPCASNLLLNIYTVYERQSSGGQCTILIHSRNLISLHDFLTHSKDNNLD